MSRYTTWILVITTGTTAAWLIKPRNPDLGQGAFECGTLLGLAVCLTVVGAIDLVGWYHRRRDRLDLRDIG